MLPCLALTALHIAAMKPASNDFPGAKPIDDAIETAMKQGRLPGAVVLVGHDGHVVYEKAYGKRSVEPTVETMTEDTVFDVASLTKVIATTSCLMKLFEQGKFRLNDKVTDYIPEFQGGHSDITLRNLMTHFSGLKPDVPLKPDWTGYDHGIQLACTFAPGGPPGVQHVYSDINFILLGELVHRLSGQTLADYARENIFLPIGMRDTMYQPPASLLPRIAPTEHLPDHGPVLRGVVHDPTARNMGGIAGHAGLFSTAADLSKFAQMMLNGGELNHHRVLSALTIAKFTEPQTPLDQPILRGLGWDIDSPYSSNRGELFPIGSFGHTGFTGTSIWIDPYSKSYVILLANAVHPDMRPSIVPLRAKVSTIAAAALGITVRRMALSGYNDLIAGAGLHRAIYRNGTTQTGLDVLEREHFDSLRGKKIGLITNHTGIDRQGHRNIALMRKAGVQVVALFSPEHGFAGQVDHPGIGNAIDQETGIQIFSLYGEHNRPTAEMLTGLDALVYDIADVGVRFYTYESTMAYSMEAAAKAHIPYIVLDRPNPITGTRVEGPPLDADKTSFVGYFPGIPVRHGMTMGELATMYNAENHIGADLTVIKMIDWERGDWFDSTTLPWVNPSPNMRSLKAAILYPGICLMESPKNFSVGRGTDAPFEQVGADFIDGAQLAAYLNKHNIPGLRVYPTRFTPTESKFAGTAIEGIRFEIVDRNVLDPIRVGLELAVAIHRLYPDKIDWSATRLLIGNADVIKQIQAGEDADDIEDTFRDGVAQFTRLREKYLLYK